jgi:hypothetical protein
VRAIEISQSHLVWVPTPMLTGARGTASQLMMHAIYGVRTAMLVFFLLFLFRALLRHQWAAAILFVTIFVALSAATSSRPLIDGATAAIYFSMFAMAVMRWGLTTLTTGLFAGNLLLAVPATTNLSAWYAPDAFVFVAVPLGLAAWGFYTSLGGKLISGDLIE